MNNAKIVSAELDYEALWNEALNILNKKIVALDNFLDSQYDPTIDGIRSHICNLQSEMIALEQECISAVSGGKNV